MSENIEQSTKSQVQIIARLKQQISKLDGDLAHYGEKNQFQAKRLKYLKKQNQELKQRKIDTLQNSNQIKEQNAFLKQQNKTLKDQLKELQTEIAQYDQTYAIKGPKQVTLKDTIVNNHTEQIDLSKSELTDQDIQSIRSFGNIKALIIGQNQIGDQGMRTICLNMLQMKKLFLNHNLITDAGLTQISCLKYIKCLDLRCNKLSDAGLQQIGKLTSLSQLSISNNNLTDLGTRSLVSLKQLKYLDITSNKITSQGGLLLLNLTELANLYLSHNKITSDCVDKYLQNMKELRVLDVRFNNISKQDKQRVRKQKQMNQNLSGVQLFL